MRQSMISIALVLLAAAAAAQGVPYPAPAGSPVPVPAPKPVPLPAPVPRPSEVFTVAEQSLTTEAQAQAWLDEQAKNKRMLVAVIPRAATEKPLFVFVDGAAATHHLVLATPDLTTESVLARVRGKGLNKTFVGSCRAGESYLLFFR
jgi:hypothetical protein